MTGSASALAKMLGPITFVAPLPGLGEHTAYTISPVEGTGDLFTLKADVADEPGGAGGFAPRLFLLSPGAYFLDYSPTVSREIARELTGQQGDPSELITLVVIHPADTVMGATANLLAPVIVHPTTRRARQVVLEGSSWPLHAPLIPDQQG